MNQEPWNPGKLLELSGFFWKTCTLHAAVKLGVFTAIGNASAHGDALAQKLACDPDATVRLLDALVAMALLEKTEMQGFHFLRMRCCEVLRLPRIRLEVVELPVSGRLRFFLLVERAV